MLVKRRRGWEIPEREATPEAIFLSRRDLVRTAAAGSIAAGAVATGLVPAGLVSPAMAAADAEFPAADLYPMRRNPKYALDRLLTDEKVATTYNNFYEFGSQKSISREAQRLKVVPWAVTIDGMVEKPITIDADALIRKMPVEERLYRHRCVEAWAMAVPWSGFPLAALVEMARPLGSAKFLQMETFKDPAVATGQRQFWYPWPYVEGLRLDEARNELAFIATGMYGKPGPKQDGAPLRLATPWKYGFKSVKSIVRFHFTDQQPKTFWQVVQGSEYGFWANVNPAFPHPRWSQAHERMIGTDEMRPTLIWNGYGEQVAGLYGDMDKKGRTLFF